MKTLYSFFASIITILLIAGCSDSSSASSDPYPIQVGAFSIQSESQAQWTGMPSTMKIATAAAIGDTLRYARPDSLSMKIGQLSASDSTEFVVLINDSTLSYEEFDSLNVRGQNIKVTNNDQGSRIIFQNGATGNTTDSLINIQFNGKYDCNGPSITENAEMIYTLLINNDEQTPYRTYILEVPGFEHVLDHIVCHKPI